VAARVRALGYPSVTAFLESIPAEPYLAAADRLGGDVAAIQLERVHLEEAQRAGTVRRAAIDSFVREVNYHLPGGWPHNPTGHFRVASVYATWTTRLQMTNADMKPKADAVWAALTTLSPPAGWLPTRVDDPLVVTAFNRGWPLPTAG
jgi:hypothetical protein